MTLPVVRCQVERVGHTAASLTGYIGAQADLMVGDIGYGEMPVTPDQLELVATALRSNHRGSRAAEVRHFEISPKPGHKKKEAWKLIQRIASDLRRAHAPGRYWLLGMDTHAKTPHSHLAIATIGLDDKPLKIGRREFLAITNLEFTKAALPAKGRGRSQGVRVHPKAKKLDARDLAHLLLGPEGSFSPRTWKSLRREKTITDVRRKKGRFVFVYKGRRIGSDTLRYFLIEEGRRRREIAPKTKDASLRPSPQPAPVSPPSQPVPLAQPNPPTPPASTDLVDLPVLPDI